MKICVLGAGVNGVSTAFALSRAGHEVHVIERAKDVAMGASAANGAQLSYSYIDPFAGPNTLRQLPVYLSGRDPAVRLGLSLKPDYLAWGVKFLRECSAKRAQTNLETRAVLALLSRQSLESFSVDCGGDFLKSANHGKIILASSKTRLEQMEISAARKHRLGISSKALPRAACLSQEPALNSWQGTWAGGLYAEGDLALDPVKYCAALKAGAKRKYGAQFHFGQRAGKIITAGGKVTAVQTDQNMHLCDRVILCLGNQANQILRGLNMRLPIYPMQGYSLTLPVKGSAPGVSITDLKRKMVFANLGTHMRIAGFMDANQKLSKTELRSKQLHELARRLWPDIADYDAEPHYWTQYRPMTPSGVPVIKESKIKGLFLNVGHGSLGYTFAPGSAMLIADMVGPGDNISGAKDERKKYA